MLLDRWNFCICGLLWNRRWHSFSCSTISSLSTALSCRCTRSCIPRLVLEESASSRFNCSLISSWILHREWDNRLQLLAGFVWVRWNLRWNWEREDGWQENALWRTCFWLYMAICANLAIIANTLFLVTDPLFFINFTPYLSFNCAAVIFTSLSYQAMVFFGWSCKFWSTPWKSWYSVLLILAVLNIFSSSLCSKFCWWILLNDWWGRG